MEFLGNKGAEGANNQTDEKTSGDAMNEFLAERGATAEAVQRAEEVPAITVEDYLKAGYSLIYIRTEEDQRAIDLVKSSISNSPSLASHVRYAEWRCTTGLFVSEKGTTNIDFRRGRSVAEPLNDAIRHVGNSEEQIVACFHNVRQFVGNFQIIQELKDAAYQARLVGSHIILVGAELDLPPELRNICTVYDLDLPDTEHFQNNFQVLADAYSSQLRIQPSDRDIEAAAASAVGMTEIQGENAIALSISKRKSLDSGIIHLEKEQAIKRNDVLEFVHSSDGMDMLGGFDNLKDWITKRRDAISPEARAFGLRFPKGVLLVGVPGTGKSLAARCISSYLRLPLLKFDIGKVFKSLVGSSESSVRSALKTAEAISPCVLWLEEIEKSMAGSQSSGSTDSGTTARVMSTILTWMQENKKPVFVVATANAVESLPPELLRKGRFSEIWGVVEPNEEERPDIWRIHIGKVRPQVIDSIDIGVLTEASSGYTGAEIEGCVEEALFDAWSDGRREVTTEDFVRALQKVVPQSVTSAQRINAIKDWMTKKVRFVSSCPHGCESAPAPSASDAWRKIRDDDDGGEEKKETKTAKSGNTTVH